MFRTVFFAAMMLASTPALAEECSVFFAVDDQRKAFERDVAQCQIGQAVPEPPSKACLKAAGWPALVATIFYDRALAKWIREGKCDAESIQEMKDEIARVHALPPVVHFPFRAE